MFTADDLTALGLWGMNNIAWASSVLRAHDAEISISALLATVAVLGLHRYWPRKGEPMTRQEVNERLASANLDVLDDLFLENKITRNDRRSWLKKLGSCLNLDAELMARATREKTLIQKIKRRLRGKDKDGNPISLYTPVNIPGEPPLQHKAFVEKKNGRILFANVK